MGPFGVKIEECIKVKLQPDLKRWGIGDAVG
jgi:hypothetical protein